MPTVQFKSGGQTHRATVPESFFTLSDEEKRKQLLSLIGVPAETGTPAQEPEGEGIWEAAKDVGKTVGGGMMGALHQLGRPQSAIAGGLYNLSLIHI